MQTVTFDDLLGVQNPKIPREELRSSDIIFRESEKCSGMTLVALSCLSKLNCLLLIPIYLERLKKVNMSNILSTIQDSYAELDLKFGATKKVFLILVV